MRTKLTLLILLTMLTGCALDEKVPNIADWIEFSSNPVYVLAGDEIMIDISYPSSFEMGLRERDPDIAEGAWYNEGKSINVKGRSVGNTVFYLVENRFRQTLELEVISEYFYGSYREGAVTLFGVYASDKEVEEEIRAEIISLAEEREGIQYHFNQKTGEVEIDYSETKQGGKKTTGTYQWDMYSLMISVNDTIEKYNFYSHNGYYELCLDLSEIYKEKDKDNPRFFVEMIIPLEKIE